jgi:hypothetical protein
MKQNNIQRVPILWQAVTHRDHVFRRMAGSVLHIEDTARHKTIVAASKWDRLDLPRHEFIYELE